ncbi:MAG TPA: NADH-quinone oxidoreductase subunit N [Verrucomicrobiae bacterium]|jgi:NADH-quinone oxidoreductase subunit N|nr:NADH-quinone oxidoreductase subunit N [Verrucomicrobiae bacterium]
MSYFDLFKALIPEAIITGIALCLLAVDLAALRPQSMSVRLRWCGGMAILGCASAIGWMLLQPAQLQAGMLAIGPLTQWIKLSLLILTAFIAVISFSARFTVHVGEYFALLLFATVGLMLLVSADNFLLIFLALELLSISLYALTAFHKNRLASAEAALKYYLFGSVAAAFTLFGISLLYGVTGEIQLSGINAHLSAGHQEPIFYIALVMTLAGFAFKLAAAPFHFWAPDVYEGAPTPIAAYIASASKVGSFFVVARILWTAFPGARGGASAPGWMPVLVVLAVISMTLGNLAALMQRKVSRLLAYSAVAHGAYAVLALLAAPQQGLPSLLFYVITYALTALGAFAVVGVIEASGGRAELKDFAGFSRRAPLLAFCLLVFMLSLAGIPPLAGFFGKFYVFTAAAEATPRLSLLWLVILAVATSAVSLYYYLQILKQVYAAAPLEHLVWSPPARSSQWAIVLLAGTIIVLGCFPSLLLTRIAAVLSAHPF